MNKSKDAIQEEALLALRDKRLASLEVSMGVGKTLIGLKHMLSLYHETCRFLVVVPKRAIIKSWKDDARKFNMEFLLNHIRFTTYLSLTKETYDYDCIYLDECHSLKFSHGDFLSLYDKVHNGRILGLTGTYPKFLKSEKGKMCVRFCPKVYTYTVDDAIEEKILNDYRVVIHQLKLSSTKTLEQKKKDGTTWLSSELKQYTYWSDRIMNSTSEQERHIATIQRMKILQSFPGKEVYAKKLLSEQVEKTIIFANTQAQADRLCEHSYHSANARSDKNLELFKNNQILKLSAVEQLSEGVTVPGLKIGIIMHSFGNNRKSAQKIGRLLRLNPDETSTIHILCYENSVDREWVKEALAAFDKEKISWIVPQ